MKARFLISEHIRTKILVLIINSLIFMLFLYQFTTLRVFSKDSLRSTKPINFQRQIAECT